MILPYIFLAAQILCTTIITGSEKTITISGTEPHSFFNRWGITKPQQWELTLTKKVAEQFQILRDILDDNTSDAKFYNTLGFWSQKNINSLFELADQKKTKTIDSIINSRDQLIECITFADLLQAKQPIQEKLLQSQHVEALIHTVFTPAKNEDKFYGCKNFILAILKDSQYLKQKFEPVFYRLVYTCPEWITANKKLESVEQLENSMPADENYKRYYSKDVIIWKYHNPEQINSILNPWRQSEAFTTYNQLFDNELNILYESYYAGYNQHTKTPADLDIYNKERVDIVSNNVQNAFIKNRYCFYTMIPSSSYRAHLPLLTHFIHFVTTINNVYPYNERNYTDINFQQLYTARELLFDPVDTQALSGYTKKQKNRTEQLTLYIKKINTASISVLALYPMENLKLWLMFQPQTSYNTLVNSPVIIKNESKQNSWFDGYLIDPHWRIKIIAPWIAIGIGAVCGYFALRPVHAFCMNLLTNQAITARNDCVNAIKNLHVTGAESALLEKISHPYSTAFKPILTSSLPKPTPQTHYSETQIDNSFEVYTKIKDFETQYIHRIEVIDFIATWMLCIPLIGMTLFAKAGHNMYKKIFPTGKLFNPIKALLPLSWIHCNRFDVPKTCSIACTQDPKN